MSINIEGKLRRPVIRWLATQLMFPVFEVYLAGGTCDIVGVRFTDRVGRSRPNILDLCAIELKMTDVAGLLRQCVRNRNRVAMSYAAMPYDRVNKMNESTLHKFRVAGVGLLSVEEGMVTVVVPANPNNAATGQTWLRDKLWRRRDEWRGRIDTTKFKKRPIMLNY